MSFTYSSTSLTTDLAKVRLTIGDTTAGAGPRPDGSNFTDGGLAIFIADALASGGTWRNAVPPVLRVLASGTCAAARTNGTRRSRGPDANGSPVAPTGQGLRVNDHRGGRTQAASGGLSAGVIAYGNYVYEVLNDGTVV